MDLSADEPALAHEGPPLPSEWPTAGSDAGCLEFFPTHRPSGRASERDRGLRPSLREMAARLYGVAAHADSAGCTRLGVGTADAAAANTFSGAWVVAVQHAHDAAVTVAHNGGALPRQWPRLLLLARIAAIRAFRVLGGARA
jgi:hypothetical protein